MGAVISVRILDEGFVIEREDAEGAHYRKVATSRQEVVGIFTSWLQAMSRSGGAEVEASDLRPVGS